MPPSAVSCIVRSTPSARHRIDHRPRVWYDCRMDFRLVFVLALVVALIIVLTRRRRPASRIPPVHRWRHRVALEEGRYPYFAKKHLLTKKERVFCDALKAAVGDKLLIAMSVRLADVINCSRESWTAGYGALISAKQLDFVLCEPHSTRIVLAIELDDETHGLADRRERDKFLDNAMQAAGVPLLRVVAASSYDVATLREAIRQTVPRRPSQRRAA